MSSRPLRLRLLLAVVLGAGVVLGFAAPAFAHAQLTSTEPVGGTAVATSPPRVVVHFGENVEIPLGSIRVFASPSGKQIETGAAEHPDGQGNSVAVKLPKLDKGTYIVTWRVTSADSHPVHGAFTFIVGSGKGNSADAALAARLLSSGGGSTTVGAVYAVIRFLAFSALVLLVGGFAFVALVWPAGFGLARPRRLLWSAWAVAAVTTLVGIPIQGVYAAGLPLSKFLSSTVLSGVVDERFGRVSLLRLGLLVLMAGVLAWSFRRHEPGTASGAAAAERPPPALVAVGGLIALGLIFTPALSGHEATQDLVPLALLSDLVHLSAVSLWLGGLTLLVAVVLPRRLPDELATVVPRFSKLAFGAVVAILATGVFQGWREVRSIDALTQTTYGKLLIIKVALFALMVGLAFFSRRYVQARYRVPAATGRLSFGPGAAADAPTDEETVARLRRTVGAEAAVAVVVLAVTALLVNAQPARSALAQPFSTEMRSDAVLVDVTVDPAKTGPAALHFYTLSPEGAVKEVQDLTASLTLPSRDVGPLAVPVQRAGPGHFVANGFNIPLSGKWTLGVKVLLSDIDEADVSGTVPVK
ncbi:MAG TPA: copper resistance protein CopC [Acidimicrobiia bacterium]|nr:copper resistance protein CopC [Acidimicrobiia bacterium]